MSHEKHSASHADKSSAGSGLGRRDFVRASVVGVAALSFSGVPAVATDELKSSGSVFAEPARKLTVVDDCDVIVCGGGPAGFSAAIAAARAGARTRLFDVNGCLGGVWTAGMLTYIFDIDKPGLPREITRRLDLRNARVAGHKDPSRYVYHVEEMKCLLEEMALYDRTTCPYNSEASATTA